jgi:hypothetical protein
MLIVGFRLDFIALTRSSCLCRLAPGLWGGGLQEIPGGLQEIPLQKTLKLFSVDLVIEKAWRGLENNQASSRLFAITPNLSLVPRHKFMYLPVQKLT